MNRRKLLGLLVASGAASLLPRRAVGTPSALNAEAEEFARVMQLLRAKNLDPLEIGDLVVECGRLFLGTPYAGGTLEINLAEQCVINFGELDCVTFFELSLDIARIVRKQTPTYDALVNEVTMTRYRGGMLTDYASRLHYTCDWFDDNERKNVVRNMTAVLGGVALVKPINYMSTHPDKYRQLREDPSLVPVIASIERDIARRTLYHIPKADVPAIEPRLQNGDIIGITTTIAGIDCSHTGIVVMQDEQARFMHASSVKGQVIIAPGSLSDYLNSVSKHVGIMVVRPV